MLILNNKYSRLRLKLVGIFILFIVIPTLALFAVQATIQINMLKGEIIKSAVSSLNYHNSVSDDGVDRLTKLMLYVSQSKSTENLLKELNDGNETVNSDLYFAAKEWEEELYLAEVLFGLELHSVLLADDEVLYRYKQGDLVPEADDWVEVTSAARGKPIWWPPAQYKVAERNSQTNTIDVSQAVCHKTTKQVLGSIYFVVDFNSLFATDLLNDRYTVWRSPDGKLIIPSNAKVHPSFTPMNADGKMSEKLVNASDEDEVIDINDATGKNLAVLSKANVLGWRVIELVTYNDFLNSIITMQYTLIAIMVVGLTCFTFFFSSIMSGLVAPLKGLINYVNDTTQRPNSAEVHPVKGYLEIMDMRNNVVSIVENRRQIEQEYDLVSRENSKHRYKQFQFQMNPHFLCNTLNSIKILAALGQSSEVASMVSDLTELLMACIDKNGEFITVKEELSVLNRYLHIQDTVHSQSIKFELEFDESLNDYECPNFILQPVTENCILHGVDLSKEHPTVRIKSYRDGENICFLIADNGVGMSEEHLEKLNNLLNSNAETTGHVGLLSVHRRIQWAYGEQYGISITSTLNKGSEFVLRFPAKKQGTSEVR